MNFSIYQGLISGKEKLALVGLGYVGLPLAVEFAKHVGVIGFDINEKRVNEYRNGIDSRNGRFLQVLPVSALLFLRWSLRLSLPGARRPGCRRFLRRN